MLVLCGVLLWVAVDTGPSAKLFYNKAAIPLPSEIAREDYISITDLCERFDPDGLTTVDIMRQIRGPVVRGLVGLIRGNITPWSSDEIALLEGQLDEFFAEYGSGGQPIAVISRSGGANVEHLKAVENAPLRSHDMVSQCTGSNGIRRQEESLYECIDRNWGSDQEGFAYTHTGFVLPSRTGGYDVLHAYPKDGHLAFFCEPISYFFGVPLDARKAKVMLPPPAEQARLREILEGPLSGQVRKMRYSLTSPFDAPNYTNSNGFTFHAIMASGYGGAYDARTIEAVASEGKFVPGIILFGHTFIGRLLDLVIPALDLSTQPYAKQGVFDAVTPISLHHHLSKRGWTTADFGPSGWRVRGGAYKTRENTSQLD